MKKKNSSAKRLRKGISLIELVENLFPDEESAYRWFYEKRWPNGPCCPHCGSLNIQEGTPHKTMTHRCWDCPGKREFSLRVGTVMESSKLSYRTWAMAIYLIITNLKGVSSWKLHRDLKITQKTAWHLEHRIRKALEANGVLFSGPVEVDESYFGGRERNKHESKKLHSGRGPSGKTAVVGMKDRKTNKISASVVQGTTRADLEGFIQKRVEPGSKVYTDDHGGYSSLWLDFEHQSVRHSVKEYVRGMAHTNGIESFWAMLKRGYYGTYHRMSAKHLGRYVSEFSGRHNIRDLDTIDQMKSTAKGMEGKRLRYRDLIA